MTSRIMTCFCRSTCKQGCLEDLLAYILRTNRTSSGHPNIAAATAPWQHYVRTTQIPPSD